MPSDITDEQKAIITMISYKLIQLGHELRWTEPISVGPLVTTYRFELKGLTKLSQIKSLSPDIALALKVDDVLIDRIPGEAVLGITVPNKHRSIVMWRDIVGRVADTIGGPNQPTTVDYCRLPLLFGIDALGKPFIDSLETLPHLLICGSTGGGKSVLTRSLLSTLMYYKSPNDVQFVISDTKRVEFPMFEGSQHLMVPRTKTVMETLQRMDELLDIVELRVTEFERSGVQNIHEYNKKRPESKHSFIILVIDELADLLAGEERGEAKLAAAKLSRIVQKSRAAGIYVIACTQRPSVDVVAGSIKANFPARLSFRLPSEQDSRTVLGSGGAEHLLSRGDMLYASPNRQAVIRLHSAFASNDDIHGCLEAVKYKSLVR